MATPMHPVKSSQISYIGYDEDSKELFVTFKNGSTYKYEDVPKNRYEQLMNCESIGKYFGEMIKNVYEFTKIK
jgi:hypothetical protein